jgi:hypothetical protein
MGPSPPHTNAGISRKAIFLVALFVVPVVLIAVVLVVLWLVYRPAGKRVAEIDLLAPPSTSVVNVDVAAGDRLLFQMDLVIDAPPVSGSTKEKRRSTDAAMAGALRASTVTIQASATGPARTTTCPAFGGVSFTTSLSEDWTYEMQGVQISCAIPIDATGRHAVTASITWGRELRVRSAKLEVRRAAP